MESGESYKLRGIVDAMQQIFRLEYSSTVTDLYVEVLEDRSFEQVKAAIVGLLKTAKFMPTLAEICKARVATPTSSASGRAS
jgi:hypothetical protein